MVDQIHLPRKSTAQLFSWCQATLLAAPRPRSGFLRFEAPTAPPQHVASVSARASGLREDRVGWGEKQDVWKL